MIVNRSNRTLMRAVEAARAEGGEPRRRSPLRPRLQTMAIEPRMLFDGAAPATADAACPEKPSGGGAAAHFGAPPGEKAGGPGPSNHAPIAQADARSTDAVTPIGNGQAVLGNAFGDHADVDADGDALTVLGVTHGTPGGTPTGGIDEPLAGCLGTLVMHGDGSYAYVPGDGARALAPGEISRDVFTYSVGDGRGGQSTTTLTITVTGGDANHPPVANCDWRSTGEAQSIVNGQAILGDAGGDVADTDADGDALHVSGVARGWQDSNAGSALTQGTAQDIDGDYGRIRVQADGSYSYVPFETTRDLLNAGDTVRDYFTYTIADTAGATSTSYIKIFVTGEGSGAPGVNHPPVANFDSRTMSESQEIANGQAIAGNAGGDQADTDVDGDALHMTGVSAGWTDFRSGTTLTSGVGQDIDGQYGRLHLEADGSYTYVPFESTRQALGEGDTVRDLFSYTVADTAGASANSYIKIYIEGESHLPVARDDARTILDTQRIDDGEAVRGNALGDQSDYDDDGDAISVVGIGAGDSPAVAGGVGDAIAGRHGTLVIQSDGSYTYRPYDATRTLGLGENVQDAFDYRLLDDRGGIAHATITITIVGTDELVARPDVRSTDQNTPVSGNAVTGGLPGEQTDSDSDGHAIAVTGLLAGSSGAASGHVGEPVQGSYGTLTLGADGAYTYVPGAGARALGAGQSASDVFTYTIADGHGSSSTTTITILIAGRNDAPIARPDVRPTDERTPVAGNVVTGAAPGEQADSDPDGDTIVVQGVRAGAGDAPADGGVGAPLVGQWGTLTLNADGSYSYVPSPAAQALRPGQSVEDVFTYTVNDGRGGTSTTTLTIDIDGLNNPPLANPDANSIASNATLPAAGNAVIGGSTGDRPDSDADAGDKLVVTDMHPAGSTAPGTPGNAGQGTYGQLVMNPDGSYSYTVNRTHPSVAGLANGATLTDQFVYTVHDGAGATSTTTVTITVVGSAGGGSGGSPGGATGGTTGGTGGTGSAGGSGEPAVIASGPSGITGSSGGAGSAPLASSSALSDVPTTPVTTDRIVMPADPFGLLPPTRVAGFVEEAADDPGAGGPIAKKEAPGTPDKLAAGPARKTSSDRDDCIPEPKAKPRPVAVKRSAFAEPLGEKSKAFSEQIQAAKKRFTPPAKVVPRTPLGRDC